MLARLVGAMFVVMLRVLCEDPPEVSFAVDQQVVEALAPCVPAYRSANEFALGERTGVLMIRIPLPANTSSNTG